MATTVSAVIGLLIASASWTGCRPAAPTPPTAPSPVSPTPVAGTPDHPDPPDHPDLPLTTFPTSTADAASFVGDAPCRSCHARAFREHHPSPHADTLVRVTPKTVLAQFDGTAVLRDQRAAIDFRPIARGGKFYIEASDAQNRMEGRLDLRLGSGVNATTYLYRPTPEIFVQLRASWFPGEQRWDYTPKLAASEANPTPIGAPMETAETLTCLGCHSTTLRLDLKSRIDLDQSRLGIGCERCHGPGRDHIQAVKARLSDRRVLRLSEVSSADISRLCGQCHSDQTAAKSKHPVVLAKTRAEYESGSMSRSRCFTETGGRLRCTTCHEPHSAVEKDPAVYVRACLSCHTAGKPEASTCPVNSVSGCIGCHMPSQIVPGNSHYSPPTHWIRIYPGYFTARQGATP